jgi:hypothetical protein
MKDHNAFNSLQNTAVFKQYTSLPLGDLPLQTRLGQTEHV